MFSNTFYKIISYLTLCSFLMFNCTENKLPILGKREISGTDTIYAEIPEFRMLDQNGDSIKLTEVSKGIHLAAFFFTSCPTICPKVMRNIGRISDKYRDSKELSILCFSLDYKRDSIPRLKEYYTKVGFENPKLHLLRANNPEEVKELAKNYMSTAIDDNSAPGGINHSGWILLVDRNRHIRSYALGTDDVDVDRLIKDIQQLLNE